MSIIAWIVLGLLAGWLAGVIMRGGGYGLIGDLVLGVVGAIIGGWITGAVLGSDMVNGFNIQSLIVAIIGAIVLIAISRLFTGSRARV
ncbi:MAG: GlsB/YeaQ/YmgE family stress response membrane protein [Chloroflexi bacterium]|nr:GlsB/YeaQ/YmgE family stress response membrane protein [Chloroflexota bacterium]